jgi:predicted nucleic acid-binding protein
VIKPYSVKAHYLDASALVKLVADDQDDEKGRDALRDYYWKHPASMYATSYCVAETLGVFKRKQLHKKITNDEYIQYVQKFIHRIVGVNLRIDELSVLSPVVLSESEDLFRTHGIDIIDSLQIVTVLHGQYRILAHDSKTILITADEKLAEAAGQKVQECGIVLVKMLRRIDSN